jgi:predicted RecB family nuclease
VKSLAEPLFIEQLEGRFELELSFDIRQQTVPIKFVGYIDRIDRIGEKYRVIDYKSGKAAAQDVKFTEKNDALTNLSKPTHTLQLSLYCLFFQEKFGFLPQEARIESLINRDENFALNIEKQQGLSRVPELINEGLTALLTELLDPTINFGHDTGSKYCQFCN